MTLKILTRLRAWVECQIWERDLGNANIWHRGLVHAIRLVVILTRDMLDGQLNLRAMSMVYTTLLALVPLLALGFSVLKGFGVHNQIEPFLYTFLQPLGPRGEEIARNIIAFVDNVKVGVLGTAGLLLLLYTVISLIQKIEAGFNYVWRVEQSRNIVQRMTGYLSVLLIGPLLMVSAISITATVSSNTVVQHLLEIEPFGSLMVLGGKLMPYLMVSIAFTICYLFIPNTRVRPGAALTGGVVAGVLWESAGRLFASFVTSSGRYDAIYSGFAIVLVFMIWLYISWLILLLGAQLAFYQQNPRFLMRYRIRVKLSNRLREKLALLVLYHIARHFALNKPAWTAEILGTHLGVAGESLAGILSRLQEYNLIVQTEDGAYLPARDLNAIKLRDIVQAVRETDRKEDHPEATLRDTGSVSSVMEHAEQAMYAAMGETTLRDLVSKDPEE